MNRYLNAGFGNLLGFLNFEWIKRHGFVGIRQDIPWGLSDGEIYLLLQELRDTHTEAILLIAGQMVRRDGITGSFPDSYMPPIREIADYASRIALRVINQGVDGISYELGNEYETRKGHPFRDPQNYAEMIRTVSQAIWSMDPSARVLACSMDRSLAPEKIAHLGKILEDGIPEKVEIAIHPYRRDKLAWEDEPERMAQTNELLKLLGPVRQFQVTEMGWHTQEQKKGSLCWKKKFRFSDDDVSRCADWEAKYWHKVGVEIFTWFQLNDGIDKDPEAHYGIRYVDGNPKPVALTFKEMSGVDV